MKKIFVVLLMAAVASVASVKAVALSAPDTESTETYSNEDIIKICKYLTQTVPSLDPKEKDMWTEAFATVLMFATNTNEFTITIGDPLMETLELNKNSTEDRSELIAVQMAAEISYLLEHHLKESNAESFAYSMEAVVNIYSRLPKQSIKTLNKYLKMDKEKRRAEFIKLYNKKMK